MANIFMTTFSNGFYENPQILIKISLKFVLRDPINNIPAMVQIMAWRQPGNKPLSEAMMARLSTHICIIQPQSVNNNSTFENCTCILQNECLTFFFSFFSTLRSNMIIHSCYAVETGNSRSIAWLLMPWLLASPGHQRPWHWLRTVDRSFYTSKNRK